MINKGNEKIILCKYVALESGLEKEYNFSLDGVLWLIKLWFLKRIYSS